MSDNIIDIEEAHDIACKSQQKLFLHHSKPGYMMTAYYLTQKGKCCGNKCLFCPYNHQNVKNHICSKSECPYVYKKS